MGSPVAVPLADIGLYWTDEEIFTCLVKLVHGSCPPHNVIAKNPYLYMPENLPDGVWYFIRSEEKIDAEFGFWKAKDEEPIEIYRNSIFACWRTTLEFYQGRAPYGKRTGWMMQEYKIAQKGDDRKKKDFSSLLCRIFFCEGQKHSIHSSTDITGSNPSHAVPSIVPSTGCSGHGSTNSSKANHRDDEEGPLPISERLPIAPVEDLSELDCISSGDYLELNDLLDLESPSSSGSSSCPSLASDECFDSLALMQDLEDERIQNFHGKDSSLKFFVSESARPNEVVMLPASSGSLISRNGSKSPDKGRLRPDPAVEEKFLEKTIRGSAVKMQRAGQWSEVASNSCSAKTSSSDCSTKLPVSAGKKTDVGIVKKIKHYICFGSF